MRLTCEGGGPDCGVYDNPARSACDLCGKRLCDKHCLVTRHRQDLCAECHRLYVDAGRPLRLKDLRTARKS